MGIFVYFHRKLFYTGLLYYFFIILDLNSEFRDFQIVGSETVIQRICFINSCGLFLRDIVA